MVIVKSTTNATYSVSACRRKVRQKEQKAEI